MREGRLSPLEEAALEDFSSAVRARLGARLASLVLYGSRARGEGRDDSDLDLLVEVRGLTRSERGDLLDLAADVGLAHHLVLSPLVVEAGALARTPLAAAIEAEGRPL